jgi:hypothetical protein
MLSQTIPILFTLLCGLFLRMGFEVLNYEPAFLWKCVLGDAKKVLIFLKTSGKLNIKQILE